MQSLIFTREQLLGWLQTDVDAIAWCRQQAIIPSTATCPLCQAPMIEKKHHCMDNAIWSCSRTINGVRHYQKVSLRHGSIFADTQLPVKTIVRILYEWSRRTERHEAAFQLELNKDTVGAWYKRFRKISGEILARTQNDRISGAEKIIEIDECQLARRKHNHGRVPREQWVFGGVVRRSNPIECFIELVPSRSRGVLCEVIQRRISPEVRIISDGWAAYANLTLLGFRHDVVNHSHNYVSATDPTVHTQNVENLWRCVRRFLAKNGTNTRRNLQGYINKFIFRKLNNDAFESIIHGMWHH